MIVRSSHTIIPMRIFSDILKKQSYIDEIQEVRFSDPEVTKHTQIQTLPGNINFWPEIWVFGRTLDFWFYSSIWSGIHPEWSAWVLGVS